MDPLIFRPTDIEEMTRAFSGWQMDIVQQERGAFAGRLHSFSQLGGQVRFCSVNLNKRVFGYAHHAEGSVMFTFVECPEACTWNGERIHPLKLFVSDANRGIDVDAGKGFVSFSVSVERNLLEKWFWEEGLPIPGNWNFSMDFKRSSIPVVALVFKRVITNAVFRGIFDLQSFKLPLFKVMHPVNQDCLSRISINFAPIHDAVEMIHEAVRNGREVNLQDVLEFYGAPMRTFYYNFKKYTGFTPHQYIKNLRLSAAHKILKMSDADMVGVREVAYRYGFRHLGQFAQDYKLLFGEVPSKLLRKRYDPDLIVQ